MKWCLHKRASRLDVSWIGCGWREFLCFKCWGTIREAYEKLDN